MAKRKTDSWIAGDGLPAALPAGVTNEWGGNLRNEGRPVLLRRDANGLIDGYSTTSSTVVPAKNGGYAVIPTVVDGKDVGSAEAYRHYLRTGEHWGTAATIAGAEELAQSVHERHMAMNTRSWNEFISESLPALSPALRRAVEESDDRAVREAAKGGRANRRSLAAERFRAGWYQDAQGNWVDPSRKRGPIRLRAPYKPVDINTLGTLKPKTEAPTAREVALLQHRKETAAAQLAAPPAPARKSSREEVERQSQARMAKRARLREAKNASVAEANANARAKASAQRDTQYGHAQFPTGSGQTSAVDSATFTRKLELAKLMAERYRGTDKYQAYMDRIAKLEASGPVDKNLQAQIRQDQDRVNREAMGNYGRTVYEVNTDNGRLAGTGNDPYGTGIGATVKKSADRRVTVGTLPGSNLQDVIRPGQTPTGLPSVGEMAQRSMRTGAQGAWGTMLQRYQADAAARRAHKLVGQYTGGEVTYGYDAKRGRRVRDLDEPAPTGAALKAGRARRAATWGGTTVGGNPWFGSDPLTTPFSQSTGNVGQAGKSYTTGIGAPRNDNRYISYKNDIGETVISSTPNDSKVTRVGEGGWVLETGERRVVSMDPAVAAKVKTASTAFRNLNAKASAVNGGARFSWGWNGQAAPQSSAFRVIGRK